MSLQVLKPGLLTTVQDRGRLGLARFGIGASGAMDRPCFELANTLVGNRSGMAALEITLLGPVLRFGEDALVALTGAAVAARVEHEAGSLDLPPWRPVFLRAGSVLRMAGMASGVRSYLAVAGGLRSPVWMDSASVDLHAGIGRALAAGDELQYDSGPALDGWREEARASASWSLNPAPWFDLEQRPIRLVAGPHFEALDGNAQRALFESEFSISADSNRVGIRLSGQRLQLDRSLELISEPLAMGSVQLPPAGAPIILMCEHPSTGGYPRIARVAAVDLPLLAQHRPGALLRFERIDQASAEHLLIRRDQCLQELSAEVQRRLLQR